MKFFIHARAWQWWMQERNISHFSVAVFAGTKLQFSTQVGSLKKVGRQYECCCSAELLQWMEKLRQKKWEVTLIVEFISKIIIDHGRKKEEDQQQAVCIKPHKSWHVVWFITITAPSTFSEPSNQAFHILAVLLLKTVINWFCVN